MDSGTRYAQSGDVSIAYRVLGAGPVDLVVVPGIVSHVEAFDELPGYARFLGRLARHARVITFDKRGNGLSDRVAEAPDLYERMDDVRAVLDACGSRRAVLLGLSEGGAMSLLFAAEHPARCAALVLFGAFPRMLAAPGYEAGFRPADYDALTSGMIERWGDGSTLLTLFGPTLAATGGAQAIAARCERLSATPTTLRALWRMNASIDVRAALPRVKVPVTILHRDGDRVVPSIVGRYLAATLPHARHVALPGEDHFPFVGDADRVVAEIEPLLGAPPGSAPAPEEAPTEHDEALDALSLSRLLQVELDTPIEIGRFEVKRALGSGGMGTVFLAVDRDLERPVALKVLRGADAAGFRRFRREATAVARLNHPNVVQIHELGLDASVPYLVMEYVAGGTLANSGAMEWRRAVRLIASAARGLGAAHAVGIVHRDVKPANLLLPSPDALQVKVADFGVAKLTGAEPLTREGALVGTIGYLAPEQARGDAVDARVDVYALGVTLHRLLTGELPFRGTPAEVVYATMTRALPAPAGIPEAVARLVPRLSALEPEGRPVDGNAAADELDALLP